MDFFDVYDFITERHYHKIQDHLEYIDKIEDNLFIPADFHIPYFLSTYINPVKDRKIKERINLIIKNNYQGLNKNNRKIISLLKPKIAIASENFCSRHSIHRCYYEFIKELEKDYDLTLIEFGELPKNTDHDLFKEVINIKPNAENNLKIAQIINSNFSVIYYPDIGMNMESILLSNLRLANIQVTGYGHPVSTFGSEIDYFIGGFDTEILKNYQSNYSEKLILIPGLAVSSLYPDYIPKNIKKNSDPFIIICPWTIQKINFFHLNKLKELLKNSNKKLLFRFFPALNSCKQLQDNLVDEIAKILGKENIEVIGNISALKYMELFEEGDICIDSYPFGGHNIVVDSLFLGKPIIAIEGEKAYNKFAGAILKKLNLDELIARNYDDYLNKIINIINNDQYRESICKKITPDNFKNYYQYNRPEHFKKAIDYIIENNDKLAGNKEPIIIT